MEYWRGYKLHLSVIDGDIPISAILTGANLHDSQVAIPLMQMCAQRVTGLYDLMDAVRRGRTPSGPAMRKVLKAAFTDRNIERLDVSIREVEAEMDERLPRTKEAFRASALVGEPRKQLEAERRRLVAETGARARQKLEYERDALQELLQQSLRIKIEVSRKEREALETSLAAGSQVEVMRRYKFATAVSDEHEYWPYEGEFWRDELGTYSYTLTKGCAGRATRADAARQ